MYIPGCKWTMAFGAAIEQSQVAGEADAFLSKAIIFALILLAFTITLLYIPKIYRFFRKWFSLIKKNMGVLFTLLGINEMDTESFEDTIKIYGYAYDPEQDIFYSIRDPWQRKLGYCRLYDEATVPMGMVVDCEPVYFNYCEKKWLIEFWKGQYDMTTGCEIGIYNTKGLELNIPNVFNGTFYNSASDEEQLQMSCTLKKNGEILFTREDVHWWLTGFKLGEFSEPSELIMDINIIFKDEIMRNEFVAGLMESGYSKDEIIENGNSVSFIFDKAHTYQPVTNKKGISRIIQMKNKKLCDKYMDITGKCVTMREKLDAIRDKAPELYGKVLNVGRPKQLYEIYEIIKNYLK